MVKANRLMLAALALCFTGVRATRDDALIQARISTLETLITPEKQDAFYKDIYAVYSRLPLDIVKDVADQDKDTSSGQAYLHKAGNTIVSDTAKNEYVKSIKGIINGLKLSLSTTSGSGEAPKPEEPEFNVYDWTSIYRYDDEYKAAKAAKDASKDAAGIAADIFPDAATVGTLVRTAINRTLTDDKFDVPLITALRDALAKELAAGGKVDTTKDALFTRLNFKAVMREVMNKVLRDKGLQR